MHSGHDVGRESRLDMLACPHDIEMRWRNILILKAMSLRV